MSALIRPIDAVLPGSAGQFGEKARNLALLVRAGFPVPASWAMSAEASNRIYTAALPQALRPQVLFAHGAPSGADLDEARSLLLGAPLEVSVAEALRETWRAMQKLEVLRIAVRSSSLSEDQAAVSAAGMHESVLNVADLPGLFDAVKVCLASVFSPQVASYLGFLSQPVGAMGLILQAMVPAEVSGVMFTANPITGDTSELVINAAYGLGTGVVDGTLTPDSYRIEKSSHWLRDHVIGSKHQRVQARPTGGLDVVEVPAAQAQKLALDDHMLELLINLGQRIEDHFREPRDIEWAIAEDTFYVLQARPITTGLGVGGPGRAHKPRRSGGRDARRFVWSNINVGEALPGVATPLTWSVLSGFSELGFRRAFAALGCSVPKDSVLVGNFRGRIYLNLSELARIGSQVPGLRPASVFPLGGGGLVQEIENDLVPLSSTGFLLRLPATVTRLVGENAGLSRRVESFERRFEAEVSRIQRLDLRILPAASLDETLSDVQQLLDETGGFALGIYGGLLASMLALQSALRVGRSREAADRIQRDLLSGLDQVDSAAVGWRIEGIAALLAQDAQLAARFGSPERRPARLEDLPQGPVRTALAALLAEHGHRAVREAELAEPRWREDPRPLFAMLALQLRSQSGGIDSARRAAQIRGRGQQALAAMPLPIRSLLTPLVSVVQHRMRLREQLRSHVIRVLGLFRLVALDASRRMRVREPSLPAQAAVHLSLDELHAYLRGELQSVLVRVRARVVQLDRDAAMPAPPDTFVGYPRNVGEAAAPGAELRGQPGSGGVVEGRARVLSCVAEASALEPGEILVVRAVDVGWTPLFLVAGGLVSELGGPLSHACVVAREYGLPAVLNVPGATQRVRTGDLLRVDGDTGEVQLLG
jgi:phosphohistidine swiveling domain-containing protein